MIKIAIQVKTDNPIVGDFLKQELEALLDRLEREVPGLSSRMDMGFNPKSTERIPTHDEVGSIIK